MALQFSRMQQRRARQIHRFLLDLHVEVTKHLGAPSTRLSLYVLNKSDWQKVLASPYGIGTTKLSKHQVQLFSPAEYPQKLLHQFDTVFLEASFKPLGDISELLDLMLGFEWAHALLRLYKLTAKEPLITAVLCTYLYLLSLEYSGWDGVKERLLAWTQASLNAPQNMRSTLQTAKAQKAITERYRLWCNCTQLLSNTSFSFDLFHDLQRLKSPAMDQAGAVKKLLEKYAIPVLIPHAPQTKFQKNSDV